MRVHAIELAGSMSEAMTAQLAPPSSLPANNAFLRLSAIGRMDRSTVLVSFSMRTSSRARTRPQRMAAATGECPETVVSCSSHGFRASTRLGRGLPERAALVCSLARVVGLDDTKLADPFHGRGGRWDRACICWGGQWPPAPLTLSRTNW